MAENFEASEPSFNEPNSQAASIGLVAHLKCSAQHNAGCIDKRMGL
jgi:hypothetical protein